MTNLKRPNLLIIFGFWMLMVNVLNWGLVGNIRSRMTQPAKFDTIDTLDDMIDALESKGYWWMSYNNTPFYVYALNEVDEKFKRLKKVSNITKGMPLMTTRKGNEKFILFDPRVMIIPYRIRL